MSARTARRGVILPVVLFVLVLIGLLAAMFSFRVHADLSATHAGALRLQTRLAAEAGVEYVRMILRDSRFDRSVWYNNPEEFNRIIVLAHDRDSQTAGTNQEFDENFVFRFSIVADDPTDDKDYIRFGITDEAAKLNLNTATEPQLLKIVGLALGENSDTDPQEIVNAILDWRDDDVEPRGEVGDTESVYYKQLDKPYRVKNGPFDSVEELLLVKGITPALLYGEDFDRNGLVTENEKDGDRSFPDDNQDDLLNRGLYPYLTVMSKENNVSNDNRPRTYLKGPEEKVRAELALAFPDEPDVVEYIISTVKTAGQQGGEGQGDGGGGGGDQSGGGGAEGPGSGRGQQPQLPGGIPGGSGQPRGRRGNQGAQPGTGQQGNPASPQGPGAQSAPAGNDKADRRRQRRDTPPQPAGKKDPKNPQGAPRGPSQGATPPQGSSTEEPRPESEDDSGQQAGSPGQPQGQQGEQTGSGQPQENEQGGQGEQEPSTEEGGQEGEQGDGGGEGQEQSDNPPLKSPASLMLPRMVQGQMTSSPITVEQLAVLMDRTTLIDPKERNTPGLINVNTAPPEVLECVDGLTEDHIEMIMAIRDRLDAVALSTTAWLVAEGVMDAVAYEKVATQITARGQQFTIESLGFADHVGMVTRLQVVVDMNGPIAQTVYYRDISNLGGAFPIREEDKEKIRGR